MEFIKQMVEKTNPEQMKLMLMFGDYENMGTRIFNPIECDKNVSLSVQASYGHYCNPRKTLPLDEYNRMELAVFLNGEFVPVDEVIHSQSLIDQFDDFYEGTVYGHVPVELIEDLYLELITT
ncbi:hypothetical protein [Aquibacillus saliphilus]|uniref:hypothetical protein n=1 Tax=Aquibacillus saliphilus TaxID=1909422 RepID=UPI001CF095C1|nr:hypothetical protein [Aquibacillus saliphilus]